MQAEQLMFTWIQQLSLAGQKTGGEPNEGNEMWQQSCVDWIPFIATPKGKKKKERSKKWHVKWPTSKFKTSANVPCAWTPGSIEKMEVWVSLGVLFVGHMSCLWLDGVWDICKFRPAKTVIKEVILALLVLHLLLHSRIVRTSVLTRQVKGKERDRTGSKQLKGFKIGATKKALMVFLASEVFITYSMFHLQVTF